MCIRVRLSNSYQQAQATQDAMRQREMQDLAAIMQLGSIPGQYAGQSLNFANQRAGAAFNAAQMKSGAALGKAGATSGMIGSALQGFNSQEGMKFTNPFAGLFSTPKRAVLSNSSYGPAGMKYVPK